MNIGKEWLAIKFFSVYQFKNCFITAAILILKENQALK